MVVRADEWKTVIRRRVADENRFIRIERGKRRICRAAREGEGGGVVEPVPCQIPASVPSAVMRPCRLLAGQ